MMMFIYSHFDIWSSITNYILSPLKSFLQTIFNTVFGTIINAILVPVLKVFFIGIVEPVLGVVWEILKPLLMNILYGLLVILLDLLSIFEEAFDIFSGMANVTVKLSGGQTVQTDLLSALMNYTGIGTVFYIITGIGILLAFVIAAFTIAKSAGNLDGKLPLSKAIGGGIRSAMSFVFVPMFVVIMLQLSKALLQSIDNALNAGVNAGSKVASIPNIIFYLIANDAVTGFNWSGREKPQMSELLDGSIQYSSIIDLISNNISVTDMHVFSGIFLTLFIIIILCMSIFVFISRIFEVILLYLVAPLFSASIPLDEGATFKRWMNMFIAKVLAGYGIVIMMKMYLLLIPFVINGKIVFSSNAETNVIFSMVFLAGGAYAVFKSSALITSIINVEATGTEHVAQEIGGAAGGVMKGIASTAGDQIWNGPHIGDHKFGTGLKKPFEYGVDNFKKGTLNTYANFKTKGATSSYADYKRGNYKGGEHYSSVKGNEYAGTKQMFVPLRNQSKADKLNTMIGLNKLRRENASEDKKMEYMKQQGYMALNVEGMTQDTIDKKLSKYGANSDNAIQIQEDGSVRVAKSEEKNLFGRSMNYAVMNSKDTSEDLYQALFNEYKKGDPSELDKHSIASILNHRVEEAKKNGSDVSESAKNFSYNYVENRGFKMEQADDVNNSQVFEALYYFKESASSDLSEHTPSEWLSMYNNEVLHKEPASTKDIVLKDENSNGSKNGTAQKSATVTFGTPEITELQPNSATPTAAKIVEQPKVVEPLKETAAKISSIHNKIDEGKGNHK